MCSSNVTVILRCLFWFFFFFFFGGGGCARVACAEASEKNNFMRFHSVQFLASFISFYFEILSYLYMIN